MIPRVGPMASVAVVVAGLYLARGLLVPVLVAVLLSLLLAPAVNRVQRLGLGRFLSTLLVSLAALATAAFLFWLITLQFGDLAGNLPRYETRLRERAAGLGKATEGSLDRFFRLARLIESDVQKANDDRKSPAEGREPVPVKVVEAPSSAFGVAGRVAGSLAPLLAQGAVVAVLVPFLLAFRLDIRDRLLHLLGPSEAGLTAATIDEAARSVARYLLLHSIVNAIHGTLLGAGLFLLGIPNALLWGVLAAVLRFVPYVGPTLGSVFPILATLGEFDGWSRPLLVAGFIILLEIVSNNVLEPVVYGRWTGLSPLAIVVSAVFWAWLWGGIGLVLSVPMSVSLAVLGRHFPRLRFLHLLLSDDPQLDAPLQFYNRLLGGNLPDAQALLDRQLEGRKTAEAFDSLLLPSLMLVEQDVRNHSIDEPTADRVRQQISEVGVELGERLAQDGPPPRGRGLRILCLPSGAPADERAAELLAILLRSEAAEVEVVPAAMPGGEKAEAVVRQQPDLVCLSVADPTHAWRARYLLKQIRRKGSRVPLVAGLWSGPENAEGPAEEGVSRATRLNAAKEMLMQQGQAILLARRRATEVRPG